MANILAVDDDRDLCTLLKTALERDGHTVETRTSGTQLTDTLCRWADCILLDVMMPGEDGFAVFNGPDEQFVSGRVMGADGGIGGTYAVMPELFIRMNELIEKGDMPTARAIQYKADRIIYKMCEAKGNLYAVMKEILRRMYGLELGGVRAPLANLAPEDEAVVAEAQKMIEEAIAAL